MLTIASGLLVLAAALGAALALTRLRLIHVPVAAGTAHGALATAGAITLAVAVFSAARTPAVNAALLCFVCSWIGGMFNLLFRRQGAPAPGFMIALHAVVAVLGLILLGVGLSSAIGAPQQG